MCLRLACVQSPPPPQTLLLRFLGGVGGGCTQAIWNRADKGARFTAQPLSALIGTDNPVFKLSAEKFMDKVRRIVHSKLKLFHSQIKTYYLSEANHQTDNLSHTKNPSPV